MNRTFPLVALLTLMSLAPASQASDEKGARPVGSDLTLGVIQRYIKAGMSTSEIVDVVGSPNLVTRGRNGRESWVYDRFSTEISEEAFRVGGGGMGAGGSFLGALGVNGGRAKSTTTQRTLLLVVTFDAFGLVETFTYRSSKF